MWVKMSLRHRDEKEKFNLVDCCEDCEYFCQQRSKCAMLYPVKPHLKETFAKAKSEDRIYFCKMFEAKK